jgi:DNA replication protein DnaC
MMAVSNIQNLFPTLDTETRKCPRHGEYQSTLFRALGAERWSPCPECHQESIDRENAEMTAQVMADVKRAQMNDLFGRAAIPKRFQNRTLDSYRTEHEGEHRAHRAASRYADEFDQALELGASLIMCGNPGTGKTHLAVGIAKRVMESGRTALFSSVIEMARSVKECYSHNATRTERQVIADYTRPDLLVLDEVGHQHGSDTERMILFDVINARYQECRPVILITNLQLPMLKTYLDERAQDRLREGGGRVIVFDWPSRRGDL